MILIIMNYNSILTLKDSLQSPTESIHSQEQESSQETKLYEGGILSTQLRVGLGLEAALPQQSTTKSGA